MKTKLFIKKGLIDKIQISVYTFYKVTLIQLSTKVELLRYT